MWLRYLPIAALLAALSPLMAAAPEPAADLRLVLALTDPTSKPPSTAIFLYDPASGSRTEIHRDPTTGDRALPKIAGSDLLGAVRALPPQDLYAITGPASAASPGAPGDHLARMRLTTPRTWEPLLSLPLSFSETSPYGLWNRAPIFAISPDANRIAFTALRVGTVKLDRPTIRVLTLTGNEEWQIPVPTRDLYVADIAWSPDSARLAYCLLPRGDEHTLDEALLPQAGVYLADLESRTTSFLYPCLAEAVAWGPRPDRITVAVHPRDLWDPAERVQVIPVSRRTKTEEFSVPGSAQALAYADGEWLAVQVSGNGRQEIWVYPGTGGQGRRVFSQPGSEGRLALAGWARIAPASAP